MSKNRSDFRVSARHFIHKIRVRGIAKIDVILETGQGLEICFLCENRNLKKMKKLEFHKTLCYVGVESNRIEQVLSK